MRYSGIKLRIVEKILKRNGYKCESTKGSHIKFRKGTDVIVVTGASNGVNHMIWRRLVKEHKIDIGA